MSLSAIHPWNLFLLIISVPSLLAGILFSFAPESPKFLMSRGKNREALAVFQEIYRRNHNYGEFPIKTLANEKYVAEKKDKGLEAPPAVVVEEVKSFWVTFKNGLIQMSTIFRGSHVRNCLIAFTMQFGFLWNQNTIRLWVPSIYAMIKDFQRQTDTEGDEFDLCQVIESTVENPLHSLGGNVTEEAAAVCSQVRSAYQRRQIDNEQVKAICLISLFSTHTFPARG